MSATTKKNRKKLKKVEKIMACLKKHENYKRKRAPNRSKRRAYKISDLSRITAYVESEGYSPPQIIAACIYNTSYNDCLYEYAINNLSWAEKFKQVKESGLDAFKALKDLFAVLKSTSLGFAPSTPSPSTEVTTIDAIAYVLTLLKLSKKLAYKIAALLPFVGTLIDLIEVIYDLVVTDCCEEVLMELIDLNENNIDILKPLIQDCSSPSIKPVDILK